MIQLPKQYSPKEIESKWRARWQEMGIYRWDPARARNETFVVDSPPPTVSGSLHVGHVFSYTHQDLIVRQRRMAGMNIFYPMGWDDNGLPTERRVQNFFNVRCDPYLPYLPNFKPRSNPKEPPGDNQPAQFYRALPAAHANRRARLFRSCGNSSACRSIGNKNMQRLTIIAGEHRS